MSISTASIEQNPASVIAAAIRSRISSEVIFFDAVYSINTLPFARDWSAAFNEMSRVLKPGGQLLIAVQPRSKNVTAEAMRDRIAAAMTDAGFRSIEAVLIDMRPAPVACVSALR